MSTVELRLRDALHYGEGERIEANRIIVRAHALRVHRRRAIGATAGVAVLLAGAATGVSRLGRGTSATADGLSARASSAPTCPVTPPILGGVAGRGPLFADDLTSMTVCVYQPGLSSTILTANRAQTLADTMNAEPTDACTAPSATAIAPTVLMLPHGRSGAGQPVLGRPQYCGSLTNGQAERSGGSIPSVLYALINSEKGGAR